MAGIDLGRFRPNKDKNEWVDWLADDPVPTSIRNKMRHKAVEEASRPVVRRAGEKPPQQAVQSDDKSAAVSIHISVPRLKLKKPSIKIPPQLLTHKKWLIGGTAGLITAVAVTGVLLTTGGNKADKDNPAVLSESKQQADFAYSLPKGSLEETDGEVRYDTQRKVVNFRDSIGGVAITISQQPLPEGFKEDTQNKVKGLAADFSATKEITTANPTAYLGTSAKGPQTVIFSKKNLLVFIQSTKMIDEHDWAEYITNLE